MNTINVLLTINNNKIIENGILIKYIKGKLVTPAGNNKFTNFITLQFCIQKL